MWGAYDSVPHPFRPNFVSALELTLAHSADVYALPGARDHLFKGRQTRILKTEASAACSGRGRGRICPAVPKRSTVLQKQNLGGGRFRQRFKLAVKRPHGACAQRRPAGCQPLVSPPGTLLHSKKHLPPSSSKAASV